MDWVPAGWFAFDVSRFLVDLFKVGGAFLLALPIAWERERSTKIMGLRTFPLVAVASCGYVLVAIGVVGPHSDAQARIIQGLMTGIGFVGGGAILKEGNMVRGTATAASIWTIGVVGAAVAYERFEIATVISIVNFLTLRLLTPVARDQMEEEAEEEAEEEHKEKSKKRANPTSAEV